MNDLVESLRRLGDIRVPDSMYSVAADEIEALRKDRDELRMIAATGAKYVEQNTRYRTAMEQAVEKCRKASNQLTRLGFSANHADEALTALREALKEKEDE